jgi:CubicO group peptidase (beta-lactamase class C family)
MFQLSSVSRRFLATHRSITRLAAVIAGVTLIGANLVGGAVSGQAATALASDAEIAAFVTEQLRDGGYPGGAFAIVRDGQVTLAQGVGRADESGRKVTAETPFVIGSLTKAITATAVMQLVEAGAVDLDRPVTTYLPGFRVADGRQDRITVRHLLNQTSGIPSAAGVTPLSEKVTSLAAQVAALRNVSLVSDPGASFAYSNANYNVLGLLVAEVSGRSYEDYVTNSIFAPLAMDKSFGDLSLAQAAGLTDAYRFWFGGPQASRPLWRPDFLSAGWLISSADDLGRFVAAQLSGGALDGSRVLSERAVAAMHAGAAATPLGHGAYGMGWIDGRIGRTRVVSHSGSTTDMASAMYLAPERGVGLVLLFNGQSVLYELLHKPEAIGEAAFARMLGEAPGGTLSALYPAFNLALALLVALQVRALVRAAQAGRRGRPGFRTPLGRRWLRIALAVWGSAVVPVLILWTVPATLGAPWSILVHIDVGQALAIYAGLRVAIGLATAGPTIIRLLKATRMPRVSAPAVA